MKPLLMLLAFALLSLGVQAQTELTATNSPATNAPSLVAAATMPAGTNHIEIESDHGELRTETNYTAIYTGNVRATYGEAKLTCDELTIRSEKGAERPDYMLADRNVVIIHKDKDGKPIHATGERAVYTYKIENAATNELIVLTGDARIESQSGVITGEAVTWNLGTGVVHVSRQRTVINLKDDPTKQIPFGTSRTNAPATTP